MKLEAAVVLSQEPAKPSKPWLVKDTRYALVVSEWDTQEEATHAALARPFSAVVHAGGTGSGCHGPNCGRKHTVKYLYHGTTVANVEGIKKNGLKPSGKSQYKQDRVYVATSPMIAHTEAVSAVHGDPWGGKRKAQGGTPAIVVLDANHPAVRKLDFKTDRTLNQVLEKGSDPVALHTEGSIPKSAIIDAFPIKPKGNVFDPTGMHDDSSTYRELKKRKLLNEHDDLRD